MPAGESQAGGAPTGQAFAMMVDLRDEAATVALAGRLAPLLRRGDVVALRGDLGAGKTRFARALLAALGHTGEVPSPTFTLVQTYEVSPCAVWHFDLYRLTAPDEAYELGIEDAFAEAISLIEWPEVLGTLLPADRLGIALSFAPEPEARRAALTGHGAWSVRLADMARAGS